MFIGSLAAIVIDHWIKFDECSNTAFTSIWRTISQRCWWLQMLYLLIINWTQNHSLTDQNLFGFSNWKSNMLYLFCLTCGSQYCQTNNCYEWLLYAHISLSMLFMFVKAHCDCGFVSCLNVLYEVDLFKCQASIMICDNEHLLCYNMSMLSSFLFVSILCDWIYKL